MTASEPLSPVRGLLDHLFRHQAGRLVSTLTRVLGSDQLDLAEEVVQDALLRALQTWPTAGVPDNPAGWLTQVAKNGAIDRLRRARRFADKVAILQHEADEPDVGTDAAARDDELHMLLLCCHPALPEEARYALTLKAVCGFSVDEIARAFLTKRATIAQRIVRAKRTLRERRLPFHVAEGEDLTGRLASGLDVLYLMFNEGYGAYQGDNLVRSDLCFEAIRLTELLAQGAATGRPEVHALLALMLLQASRLPARLSDQGALVVLADQDRSRWDRSMIARGYHHFGRSCAGETLTPYHVQAAIAAVHAAAPSDTHTDWDRVLVLYDQLWGMTPTPIVGLNRAVAVGKVEGAAAALRVIDEVKDHPALTDYYLLPATQAAFYEQLGRAAEADAAYASALARPCSEPEKRFLERRRAALAPPPTG